MTQRIIDHEKAEILRLARNLADTVQRFSADDSAKTPEQKIAACIIDRFAVVYRIQAVRRDRKRFASKIKRDKAKRAAERAKR